MNPEPSLTHHAHGIAKNGKSFALASRIFAPTTREQVAALYAWCRRADDAIDLSPTEHRAAALETLRAELESVYRGEPQTDSVLRAFAFVVHEHAIPRRLPAALLDGMQTDLGAVRFTTRVELLDYCYRVASTVGLMLCCVFGVKDRRAERHAVHLGLAMQLTNIARDVREDWERDRLYIPREILERHGLASLDPGQGALPASARVGLGEALVELLELADGYYASATRGLGYLPRRAAFAVAAARWIYADIGRVIARRGYDVFAPRAVVSGWRKLLLCARAVFSVPWFTRQHPPLPHTSPITSTPGSSAHARELVRL